MQGNWYFVGADIGLQAAIELFAKCTPSSQVKDFQPATGKICDPNFWQQLDVEGNDPTVQTPTTPHWGGVKGFAMKTSATDGWTTEEVFNTLDGHFPFS